MELERVIEILEKHQEWRRDQNVPPKTEMQSPIEIGAAIDYALIELKKLRLSDVSGSLPTNSEFWEEWNKHKDIQKCGYGFLEGNDR